MENLHPDIILNILSRLPVHSVYQCKLVCKTWRILLRNTKVGLLFAIGPDYNSFPGEVQLYYGDQYDEININDDQHYSYKTTLTKIDMQHPPIIDRFPFESVMLGSCNGLVCFSVPHHGLQDPVSICNPITGEYVHLPRLTCGGTHNIVYNLVSGFGYHYSRTTNTDEYKVVRIYYNDEPHPREVGHVQVYTLGDGRGWRNKGETHHLFISKSICANGALYWMDDDGERKIIAFDLGDEEFRLLPSPPCFSLGWCPVVGLRLLGGYLCVVVIGESKYCVDIWAFKKMENNSSYHVKEQEYYSSAHWSWSKEVSIPWEGPVTSTCHGPFALTRSNEVLLLYNGILSWYDPKTATLKQLWDDDDTRRRYVHAIPHMNILVSLKALGEKV